MECPGANAPPMVVEGSELALSEVPGWGSRRLKTYLMHRADEKAGRESEMRPHCLKVGTAALR